MLNVVQAIENEKDIEIRFFVENIVENFLDEEIAFSCRSKLKIFHRRQMNCFFLS